MPPKLVGAARFELTTTCAQGKCATRLRYAPNPKENHPAVRCAIGHPRATHLLLCCHFTAKALSDAQRIARREIEIGAEVADADFYSLL